MENPPFFSLIIPTYNRSKFVDKALTTVCAQTFKNFEVIIVDDGSTDDTKDVIVQWQKKENRIKYFFKQNEERSIARNYGISKAQGKYINFLDSDDVQYPNHFALAFNLLERNNFPAVGHLGFKIIDSLGQTILVRNDFDNSLKSKLIHENILHGNAIFIKQDVASQINFIPSPVAVISEDWYVWLRLVVRYEICFDNTITTAVVQHKDRSLANIDSEQLIQSTRVIIDYLKMDKLFMKEYSGMTRYHFANHFTFLTLTLALTKKRRLKTLKYLMMAIKYDPTVIFRRRFLASIKHFF